jgi:hypothetical protein
MKVIDSPNSVGIAASLAAGDDLSGRVPNCWANADKRLERSLAAFVVANTDSFFDSGEKNFAIADFAGARGPENRLHRFINDRVGQNDFHFRLWDQIDAILPAAVNLGVPLLTTMAAYFENSHALNTDFLQGGLDRFQL